MAEDYLTQGIAAAKAGNKQNARILLAKAIRSAPNDERTWGWFYTVCENDKERIKCLGEILRINPNHKQARTLYDNLTRTPMPILEVLPQNSPSKSMPRQPLPSLPQKRKKSSTSILSLILALILICVCGLVYNSFSNRSTQSSQSSQPNQSNQSDQSYKPGIHRISGNNWFGCTDREYFKEIVGYAVDQDNQAFQQALAAGIYSGICILFNNGETVYLTDTAIFSGLVRIRRQGETQEYWTNIEAIK